MKVRNWNFGAWVLTTALVSGLANAGSSWTTYTGARLAEMPALAPYAHQETIVSASPKGELNLVTRGSGKSLWRKRTGQHFSAGPVSDGFVIVLGTEDGKVIAYSHASGEKLWETKLENVMVAAPTLGIKNTVVVQLGDGTVQALFMNDGAIKWTVSRSVPALTVRANAPALVNDDDIFVGFPNGRVLSINADTGSIQWERDVSEKSARTEVERLNDIVTSPRLVGNTLVVLNAQGRLMGLSRASGAPLWEAKGIALREYAVNSNGVYALKKDGQIIAIDRVTGAVLWETTGMKHLTSGVGVMGNRVIVGDKNGTVYSLSAQTGKVAAKRSVSGEVLANPIVHGNQIIVNSSGGRLTSVVMPT